ncbi:hypothetical protein [Anaerovirgula multivorans]|uniref:hypothetical protein n=1 Tax=Anaerovirgula multivorans TaxID=312168 RepID=UPI001FA913F9|nr:hypothetical protein [Anaerovirgula multivorans]
MSVVKEPEKVLDEVSNWAKLAQSWVKENGVSDGTKPKDSVTREQVWQMLYDYDRKVKK